MSEVVEGKETTNGLFWIENKIRCILKKKNLSHLDIDHNSRSYVVLIQN